MQSVLSSSGGIVISIGAIPRELDKLEVHLLAGSPENVVREFRHKNTSLQGTQKKVRFGYSLLTKSQFKGTSGGATNGELIQRPTPEIQQTHIKDSL